MNRVLIACLCVLLIVSIFSYKTHILDKQVDALRLSSDTLAEIVSDLDNYALMLEEENKKLKLDLANCNLLSSPAPMRVTVTCYNSEPSQTDSTPFITAFNWKVRPGIIAVSNDLLEQGYTPGSKVYLKGFGTFTVGDVMNDRFSNRVDIWVPKERKPFSRKNVLMVPVVELALREE